MASVRRAALVLALCGLAAPIAAYADSGPSTRDTGIVGGNDAFGPRLPETAVIGGENAFTGEYPSIVALVSADDSGAFSPLIRQFCGGTVVGTRWVMTAAHCVFNENSEVIDPSILRVVEGSLDLVGDDIEEQVVTNIFVHPEYDNSSPDSRNDIAVLEMANALQAEPVELFSGDPEDLAGVTAEVAGWGATRFSNNQAREFPNTLQQAELPLVTRATCNRPESYDGLIQEGQLCAGFVEGGVDACVGDSGGPLYIDTGSSQVQVGITSFGIGCAEPNFYGVYTSVSDYLGFVNSFRGGTNLATTEPDRPVDPDETVAQGDTATTEASTGGSAGSSGGGASGPWGVLVLGAVVYMTRRRLTA